MAGQSAPSLGRAFCFQLSNERGRDEPPRQMSPQTRLFELQPGDSLEDACVFKDGDASLIEDVVCLELMLNQSVLKTHGCFTKQRTLMY